MSRVRVLLADDHAATLRRWHRLLEPEFEIVGMVSDGESLVSEAERLSPDVIVTDVVMPGMSGPQLSARLKQLHPEMKVLYTSGYTDAAVVRHGLLNDELAFLQKPFTPTELARRVREVLDAEK